MLDTPYPNYGLHHVNHHGKHFLHLQNYTCGLLFYGACCSQWQHDSPGATICDANDQDTNPCFKEINSKHVLKHRTSYCGQDPKEACKQEKHKNNQFCKDNGLTRRRNNRMLLSNVQTDIDYVTQGFESLQWLEEVDLACKYHFRDEGFPNWEQSGLLVIDPNNHVSLKSIREKIMKNHNCNINKGCGFYMFGESDDNHDYSIKSTIKHWHGDNYPIHDPKQHCSHGAQSKHKPWITPPQWDPTKPRHRCVADFGFEHGWKMIECSPHHLENIEWICHKPPHVPIVEQSIQKDQRISINIQQKTSIMIGNGNNGGMKKYKGRS